MNNSRLCFKARLPAKEGGKKKERCESVRVSRGRNEIFKANGHRESAINGTGGGAREIMRGAVVPASRKHRVSYPFTRHHPGG